MDERLALHANNMIGYLLKGDLDRVVRDGKQVGDHVWMGQRPYRLPLTKRAVVDSEIADMLDKGIIRPLRSPWASPIMQ